MKIAYDVAPLMSARTGVGHYAATLLEHLLAVDEETTYELFAVTRSARPAGLVEHPRVALRHWRIPARVAVTIWERIGSPPGERLVGESEVVHGTNFWVPPIRRGNGVVTIHDLTFWRYPELCTPQVQRYRWIVPRVLERCALVITPCETIRAEVAAHLGYPADRIVATPEGVRGAFRDAEPDPEVAKRVGLESDYILFAGTQEPRKNLDRLIKAFAGVPVKELQLVIAGPAGWGSVDLPAVARRLGIADRVVFTGYLVDSQLGSLMAGARAFAYPSIYEGFGLAPLEAMAAGIPVVAGRAGPLPEVLGEAPFWCDPLEVASITQAIEAAVTDEAARARAIETGLRVSASYDWHDTARLTLDAYRRVAGSG